jgi:DNA polymerase-3 subunit alpha
MPAEDDEAEELEAAFDLADEPEASAPVTDQPAIIQPVIENAAANGGPKGTNGRPPPPEDPPDWHMFDMFPVDIVEPDEPIIAKDEKPRRTDELRQKGTPMTNPASRDEPTPEPALAKEPEKPAVEISRSAPPTAAAAVETVPAREPRPALILPPVEAVQAGEDRSAQMLTVTLKANGDRLRDALKIQRIFGLLISDPGIDRFAFYVFEGPKSYLVEFPNYTTRVHEELLAQLRGISGVESVQVETIVYQ